ncbi:hypothetical protein ROSI111154_22900 [Rouxiella silvae]
MLKGVEKTFCCVSRSLGRGGFNAMIRPNFGALSTTRTCSIQRVIDEYRKSGPRNIAGY